jgi:glycerol-3-phosphate dehydrogenase (NAD(P)+)
MSGSDRRIGIIGLTSWGLGIACTLAEAGAQVVIVARDPREARELVERRQHPRLPGADLPASVRVCSRDDPDFRGLRALLLAVPAQTIRDNVRAIAPKLDSGTAVVSAAKGLEEPTHLRMSEVVAQELPSGQGIAVLSGPNLVPEIIAGMPAAAVLASRDGELAVELQALLSTPRLRLYTSHDVIGVEIGGALKNVIALAAGLAEGLGYGDNAKAALMTRGLAEIVRLGVVMGADALTFSGLSGLGDLIATCASPLSRNHRAGRLLAQGLSAEEAQRAIGEVVEGIPTTAAAHSLACSHGVEMPITEQLYRVLYRGLPPREAAAGLMLRALTDESPI